MLRWQVVSVGFTRLLLSQVWFLCLWVPTGVRAVRASSAQDAAASARGAAQGSGGSHSPVPAASFPWATLPLGDSPFLQTQLPGSQADQFQLNGSVLCYSRQAGENVWRVYISLGFRPLLLLG